MEGFLDELAQANDRRPAFVTKLVRAPGARESRWAHLLCGEVSQEAGPSALPRDDELVFLRAEQQRMNAELEALKALVQRMAQELGISS